MSTPEDDGSDFGKFTIGDPRERELLVHLHEQAAKNVNAPGTAFAKLKATDPKTGAYIGTKTWSLDLVKRRMVVEEELRGKLTARKTIVLPGSGERDDRVPNVVPGPEEHEFERRPWPGDPDDDDDVRAPARAAVEQDTPGFSVTLARVRLLRRRSQDVLTMPRPCFPANTAVMGATLAQLRLAPGVERATAEGWLDVGEGVGLAFVFDWLPDDGWWLATRRFRRRAGPLAEWIGPWKEEEGVGPSKVPIQLRAVRWPMSTVTPLDPGEPEPFALPDVAMQPGRLTGNDPLPEKAADLATFVGRPFEADLLGGKPAQGPRVVVFRGRDWERYELDGELPTDLDDVVRALCAKEPQPQAVVVVHHSIVTVADGTQARCLLSVAEVAGIRSVRAMQYVCDPDGKLTSWRLLATPDQHLQGGDGWIGVEPVTALGFDVLGEIGEA